ncbi:chorismate synthase [Caproiciproducens sp. NJN-50]|uniref:chorismate synthase n=1 Tax=Acutalibacteraceae TaxID=3082771 RepID=UPI000FFE0FBA|nr:MULTISPECIES: chorismate synthase [Acutalibacteraceae]QAT50863.1 chorismate synthase [Caproiciproducens sp. NJN-50]
MIWGDRVRLTVFGESHGPAIGAVLEGLPAGEPVDLDEISAQMARRAPGRDASATPRKEADAPGILSGLLENRTTGAPLCAVIENADTRSGDYEDLRNVPRPGHADFTANIRYGGFNDVRGGGHFSGRLTAPLVFAGAVCRQILRRRGIAIGGHVLSVHGVSDTPFDPADIPVSLLDRLSSLYFPTIDPKAETAMRAEIEAARQRLDSVGGVVECAAAGIPAGAGGPLSDGTESLFSSILFGIPACKGVEFGAGFASAALFGSENNDPFVFDDAGNVRTETNHSGGILGGITTGMPVVFRAAFKPTPSIGLPQRSVNLKTGLTEESAVKGRHDPCIVPRAVPAVEAAAALAVINLLP